MEKAIIIGLGLIGGSVALELKKRCHLEVLGIDASAENLKKATELGIIEREASFEEIKEAEVVVVAIPVNHIPEMVKKVLDNVGKNTLVLDMGSVKGRICQEVENHPNRKHFVAAHPLAGTEFSGPEAAVYHLFDGKVMILCDVEKSHWQFLDKALSIIKKFNMRVKMMNPTEHDRHIAYVSHLSHILSYMLGKTVMEKAQSERDIFDMAGSGFESTVRLAKSAASMWVPIFEHNKAFVLESLNSYIENLQQFKTILENNDFEQMTTQLQDINHIREILEGKFSK